MFKGFTHDFVRAMKPAVGDAKPMPFPGKYPTRVAWRVELAPAVKGGKPEMVEYIGKPSALQFTRFLGFRINTRLRKAVVREFDQGGLVALGQYSRVAMPMLYEREKEGEQAAIAGLALNKVSSKLYYFYHAFDAQQMIARPLRTYIKPIRTNALGVVRVYSPKEKLAAGSINDYKKQIEAWWGKKDEPKKPETPKAVQYVQPGYVADYFNQFRFGG